MWQTIRHFSTECCLPHLSFLRLSKEWVPDGPHVTHLSLGSEESMGYAIGFVIEGLINEETVCIVSPDTETKTRNVNTQLVEI